MDILRLADRLVFQAAKRSCRDEVYMQAGDKIRVEYTFTRSEA